MHKVDGEMIHVSQKEHGQVTTERINNGYVSYHPTREAALANKRSLLEKTISSIMNTGGFPDVYQKQLEELNKGEGK